MRASRARRRGCQSLPGAPAAGEHQATGRVETIAKGRDAAARTTDPSLKWAAMTMGFQPPPTWPADVKEGDRKGAFTFKAGAARAGQWVVTKVTGSRSAPRPAGAKP